MLDERRQHAWPTLASPGLLGGLESLAAQRTANHVGRDSPTGAIQVLEDTFSESKQLIVVDTLSQPRSSEEALEWTRRLPNPISEVVPCHVEVRLPMHDDRAVAVRAMCKPFSPG